MGEKGRINMTVIGQAGIETSNRLKFSGLSTDTKPITYTDENANEFIVDNGSVFIEIDTGTVFIYDLTGQEWNEA